MYAKAITYDHLHVQSHNQCNIHEVYAFRNNPTKGTSVKYSRNFSHIYKYKKKCYKSIEIVTNKNKY